MSLYLASLGELTILSLPVELQRRFPEGWRRCNGPDYDSRTFIWDDSFGVREETMPCTLVVHTVKCVGAIEGFDSLSQWYREELGLFSTTRGLYLSNGPWDFINRTFSWCINNCMDGPTLAAFLQQSSCVAVLRHHVAPLALRSASCLAIAAVGPTQPLERLLHLADQLLVDHPPICVMFSSRSELEDFCSLPSEACKRARTSSMDSLGLQLYRLGVLFAGISHGVTVTNTSLGPVPFPCLPTLRGRGLRLGAVPGPGRRLRAEKELQHDGARVVVV